MLKLKNAADKFLKSFAFSLLLCLYYGFAAYRHANNLYGSFDFFELLYLISNVTIGLLFLIRQRPLVVSVNVIHWAVAFITSFSGFFYVREKDSIAVILTAGNIIIFLAALLMFFSAVILGRSFGFFPALRRIKTAYIYQIVRHPMYFSSILFKLGYLLKNPCVFNLMLTVVIIFLYDRRARFEEVILCNDTLYVEYMQNVRYRFFPGIY